MEYLLSFAQEKEDIILYHLLKNVTGPIRYVDVGANDPVDISVTKFFYDRGGSGINIEPQQRYIDQLNKERPRDINLEVGVSNKDGELTLFGEGVGASFELDNEQVNFQTAHTVPVVTLSDVFDKHVLKDEDIHFLKIDVEGWERECLEGMDFVRFRPWILCIESTLPDTDIPCHEKWEELVLGQNYVFLGVSGINRYYAASERLNGIQEFREACELDNVYKIVSYENCHGYWFDKTLRDKSKFQNRQNMLRNGLISTKTFLERTSLGRKAEASFKASFVWQKILMPKVKSVFQRK